MSNNIDIILKTPSVARELSGKFFYKKSIKNLSWLQAGGTLEYLYIPKDENDRSILLQELIPGLELNVFGKLSYFSWKHQLLSAPVRCFSGTARRG